MAILSLYLGTLPFKAWQKAEVIDFESRTNSKSEKPWIKIRKNHEVKDINGPTYACNMYLKYLNKKLSNRICQSKSDFNWKIEY